MEKVLMKGNEALAEAAVRAGLKCYFGYPITPQNELGAYLSKVMPKKGGTFLQAESEIAAINMVLGASATGVRVMTSSSSPGISLKAEGISYIAGSDLPCVIVNVQRGGPGLGTIQPSQADYWQATKAMGHGDFFMVVYAPCSVQEIVDVVFKAFDTADEYRMPVMILADGILGQMMEPVVFPDYTPTDNAKEWAANGHDNGRKKNIANSLYLQPDELEKTIHTRFERYDIIKKTKTEAELYMTEDAEIVVAAYGATARVAKSAVNLAREEGIKAGLVRPITLWPFPANELNEGVKTAKTILVCEMSMGQMVEDVRLATECSKPVEFFGRTGGIVPNPQEILAEIKRLSKGGDK